MPFVQAKCPNCGGELSVNSENDAAVCKFCNTPFIVEKAINNYNTNVQIQNASITLPGYESADAKASAIERFVQAAEWTEAENFRKSFLERYPSDYRVYWYEFLIMTKNMTVYEADMYELFEQTRNKAITLAPVEEKNKMINFSNEYLTQALQFSKKIKQQKLQEELSKEKVEKRNDTIQLLLLMVCILILLFFLIYFNIGL